MTKKIELGSTVKCRYTGFKGTAVARIEYINGCVQYEIMPKVDSTGKMVEGINMDEGNLVVIKPKPKQTKKKRTGGANTKCFKMGGR